jgi:hypothetical protein
MFRHARIVNHETDQTHEKSNNRSHGWQILRLDNRAPPAPAKYLFFAAGIRKKNG